MNQEQYEVVIANALYRIDSAELAAHDLSEMAAASGRTSLSSVQAIKMRAYADAGRILRHAVNQGKEAWNA